MILPYHSEQHGPIIQTQAPNFDARIEPQSDNDHCNCKFSPIHNKKLPRSVLVRMKGFGDWSHYQHNSFEIALYTTKETFPKKIVA